MTRASRLVAIFGAVDATTLRTFSINILSTTGLISTGPDAIGELAGIHGKVSDSKIRHRQSRSRSRWRRRGSRLCHWRFNSAPAGRRPRWPGWKVPVRRPRIVGRDSPRGVGDASQPIERIADPIAARIVGDSRGLFSRPAPASATVERRLASGAMLYQRPIFLTLVGFRSSHLFQCQIELNRWRGMGSAELA